EPDGHLAEPETARLAHELCGQCAVASAQASHRGGPEEVKNDRRSSSSPPTTPPTMTVASGPATHHGGAVRAASRRGMAIPPTTPAPTRAGHGHATSALVSIASLHTIRSPSAASRGAAAVDDEMIEAHTTAARPHTAVVSANFAVTVAGSHDDRRVD